MEVGDDPFEVKLRYNYELLEDEYQEGCKRFKALDARVSLEEEVVMRVLVRRKKDEKEGKRKVRRRRRKGENEEK